MTNPFDETYFMDGVKSGKSNYENYSWMPERTLAFARRYVDHIGIRPQHSILEIGCARGFLVKALRQMYFDVWGYDISEWAIKNCDPEVQSRVHGIVVHDEYDHIISKDCLEHVPEKELEKLVDKMISLARASILIIVPLSSEVGGSYVRTEDNMDATHVIRWPLEKWMEFLQSRLKNDDWNVSGSWHLNGLKPTSLTHPKSCGFLTLRRTFPAKTSA